MTRFFCVRIDGDLDLVTADPADDVERVIHRLDGEEPFAVCLWALPPGQGLGEDVLDEDQPYLQCAGEASALTIEARLPGGSGWEHHVLGKGPASGARDQRISWQGHETMVHSSEVFTAEEAVPVFLEYVETLEPAARLTRRPIQV